MHSGFEAALYIVLRFVLSVYTLIYFFILYRLNRGSVHVTWVLWAVVDLFIIVRRILSTWRISYKMERNGHLQQKT